MKKLLLGLASLFIAGTVHAVNPIYGTVRITTSTTISPPVQNGSIFVASGTIQNLRASTATFTNLVVSTDTITSLTVSTLTVTSSGTISSLNVPVLNSNSSTLAISAITSLSVSTATLISSATITNVTVTTITPTGIRGTSTNDNANPGNYGAYLSSSTVPAVSSTGSNQYFTIVSLTLTAGDWDLSGVVSCTNIGATVTVMGGGIGTGAGNSSSGLLNGDTIFFGSTPNATTDAGISIPSVRASLSSPGTYYLKAFMTFTVATPACSGRLSARRPR